MKDKPINSIAALLFSLMIFLYIPNGNAQEYSTVESNLVSRDTIPDTAQENKEGFEAFRLWVQHNYKIPKAAKKARVYGKINVSFIVFEDGRLGDFEVLEDLAHGTGEELIRVLRQAKKWRPGIQDGQPVRVKYTLPMFIDCRR